MVLLQENKEEVSPPFEGGVAGTIDYLNFTWFNTRLGWLILIIELDKDLHGEYDRIHVDENRDKLLENF